MISYPTQAILTCVRVTFREFPNNPFRFLFLSLAKMAKELDVISGPPEDVEEEKNITVVQEHPKTEKDSPRETEEEHSDGSRESDTTYVNGHPVIRDGNAISYQITPALFLDHSNISS